MREDDVNKLKEEYERLVAGLKDAQVQRETDIILSNPILPDEVLQGKLSCIIFSCIVIFIYNFLFIIFLQKLFLGI